METQRTDGGSVTGCMRVERGAGSHAKMSNQRCGQAHFDLLNSLKIEDLFR